MAADWPISYEELEPYYEQMEHESLSRGRISPGESPHLSVQAKAGRHRCLKLVEGCRRLGIRVVAGGPIGINAGSNGLRPHCIFRGFCLYGCKVGAKATTMLTHIPDAIAHGAEIRTARWPRRIVLDGEGRASGVRYFRTLADGRQREEVQRAKW